METRKPYNKASQTQKDMLKDAYRKAGHATKIIYSRVYRLTHSAEISAQKRERRALEKLNNKKHVPISEGVKQ